MIDFGELLEDEEEAVEYNAVTKELEAESNEPTALPQWWLNWDGFGDKVVGGR